MLHSCAVKLVDQIFCHCKIEENRKSVYVYGAELTLSTLAGCLSIILISTLLRRWAVGFVFLLVFISLRIFTGGYHAKTYAGCFVVSNFAFLCSFAFASLIEAGGNAMVAISILIMSTAIAFALTPIRNSHHPLCERAYAKNKEIGRVLILVEAVAALVLYAFTGSFTFFSIISASIAAVAAMMIVPKIQERRA